MIAVNARFDGKVIVPDEPLDLPANTRLRVTVTPAEAPDEPPAPSLLHGLPSIRIAPEDAAAVNTDPDFDLEEV